MKSSQLIATIICLSLILITAGCTDSTDTPSETTSEQPVTTSQNIFTPSGQNLTVHFLDVGQGNSILLEYNGKDMLIDAGENDQEEVIIDYLQSMEISREEIKLYPAVKIEGIEVKESTLGRSISKAYMKYTT